MMPRFFSALAPIGLGLLTLAGCGNGEGPAQGTSTGIESQRVERGFAISPVPLNLEGRNRELVGLGSYIVNALSSCNNCHTNPPYSAGGNPFEGESEQINTAHFLAGGMAFSPQIVSSNLTPNGAGLPGGLTYDEFAEQLRTGMHDGHIAHVMPWPVYKNMTEQDLRAIYEYLRAIPSAQPGSAP